MPTTLPASISLRPTKPADLERLFLFQLDEEACHLAAFMPQDHTNQAAYLEKYTGFLQNPTINMQTILVDGTIAGSISKFEIEGDAEITYWLDRAYWGQGIGSAALATFLTLETTRPLFARVAFDNRGSQKVLEKGGFIRTGTDKGFANARQTQIEEFIYQLA